jgi:DNA-binding YbaB/EbfC family protein
MSDAPNLGGIMELWQKTQQQLTAAKDALAGKTVEAESGGGLVRCVANGQGDLVSLTVDPALMGGDKKMLEDLAVGAVNLAIERARQLAQDELARATSGLALPPGLLGG